MIIIDIDNLFKKYAAENIAKLKGTVTADNVEEKKEELYASFQNQTFQELGGKTPLEFYSEDDDLIGILKEHFNRNVPVSEYLIHALSHHANEDDLIKLLDANNPEDLLLIVVEVLSHKNSKKCVNGLIGLLFNENTPDSVKDSCAEYLEEAEVFDILEETLQSNPYLSGAACELLSRQKKRSPLIKKALTEQLYKNKDKTPEYCAYLVEYGDESVLDDLYEALKAADDYVSYKEIGMAIDALGGTFVADRNFSKDKNYIKIKAANKSERKTDN